MGNGSRKAAATSRPEHHERGCVQDGHRRQRRRRGSEHRSEQQGERKHQHEPPGGALTLLPGKEGQGQYRRSVLQGGKRMNHAGIEVAEASVQGMGGCGMRPC
jgi:hypothetical protein